MPGISVFAVHNQSSDLHDEQHQGSTVNMLYVAAVVCIHGVAFASTADSTIPDCLLSVAACAD
jgi:hypothetical protein